MTDERSNSSSSTKNTNNTNNNCNNASNNNNNTSTSSNSERIIAEAAKIWFKNGLNGTNAAAAATLLTAAAAATFQLPAPPPLFNALSATTLTPPTKSVTLSTSATNGLLAPPTTSTTETPVSTRNMATSVSAANALVASAHKTDMGVIDYTLSSSAGSPISASKSANLQMLTSNHFDSGRPPITSSSGSSNCGGRLQFFKDGKFILELARSKDGEKGGWVSVPRKSFRAPSAATSATVTPTSATPLTYPKNENSTSLSFSDDNSSIQSSPWQRDHSWKQSRPRRGISKEMALFYQRPKNITLTKVGVKTAAKRRRRPYESTKTAHELFQRVDKSMLDQINGTQTVAAQSKAPNSPKTDSQSNQGSSETTNDTDTKPTGLTIDDVVGNDLKDGTAKKTNDEPIKEEQIKVESDSCDKEMEHGLKTPSLEIMETNEEENATSVELQLQEDGKASVNGECDNLSVKAEGSDDLKNSKHETKSSDDNRDENVNKRLNKKLKPRAKLCTIIQKLIDSVPARLEQLSKAPISGICGGANTSLNHTLANKVSPPSSTASRLVEYHQQHVSPRKRILREFEKVSLEDNGVTSGAGGKRSRAKGGSATGTTPKSSPSRSSASPMPANSIPTTATTIGNNHVSIAKITTTTPAPSTRLNSSYSIHSLLGGTAGSSSSSKKNCDQPATIISNVPQQSALYSNSTYQHTLLSSPKSPERGGGKSPSHVTNKKRSPPYAANSPMHESHPRSPSVANDFGSRSPTDSYKYPLSHQHAVHQTFYPPYGMSSQYVLTPSVSHSPTNATRMLSSSSSSSSGAAISSHIPHASIASQDLSPPRSSTASPREPVTTPRTVPKKTASIRREFASPTASNSSTATSCPSPGDRSISSPDRKTSTSQLSTPQQLQRSSPNAVSSATVGGSPLHYYMYPPQSNGATSPQTSSASITTAAAQTQPSLLGTSSSTNNSVSAAAAAAAAAVAYIPSVVSPSLYHPYISTLAALRHNPFWLPYQSAGPTPLLPPAHPHAIAQSGVGSSRLPSSFHPFPYNGVGAAAVAAAAAAAAFGPSTTHLQSAATQPTSMPSHSSVATLQSIQQQTSYHHQHQQQQQQQQLQQQMNTVSTSAERRNHTPKLTEISMESRNKSTSSPIAASITAARGAYSPVSVPSAPGPSAHYGLKDELSPDVPLNLSKH